MHIPTKPMRTLQKISNLTEPQAPPVYKTADVMPIYCAKSATLLQWSYPQLTYPCQHSLYSGIYSKAVTVCNITEKALRMRCTVWCWDTSILFCSKNLFTCIILLINVVGNGTGSAWKRDCRTLYTDDWAVNYQILFSISKQFQLF
jgi:hypothetical protein